MKKVLSFLICTCILVTYLPVYGSEENNENYFVVTAYYSPLPDQKYYITGNYESEKRLNGQGIAGASGKGVFSGMLAAPGKYAFGTKIYLEGLGVGSVDDRGGAIVPAGQRGYSHDRIDIWVGYGDEGLRRAMYWGKRKVVGKIISSESQVSLNYHNIPAPSWAVPKTTTLYGKKVQVVQSAPKKQDIFTVSLGKESSSDMVTRLQEILKEIGYYTKQEISGEYDVHTISAVYDFQIANKIVHDEYSKGAGSYGPKTRKKLSEVYNNFLEEKKVYREFLDTLERYKIESLSRAEKHISFLEKPLYGEISPRVRELQKALATLGYFQYKDTAIFGVKTRNSIIEYQLKNEIITHERETGAGVFGPKTRSHMSKELGKYYFLETLESHGLREKYEQHMASLDTNITEEAGKDNSVSSLEIIHKI